MQDPTPLNPPFPQPRLVRAIIAVLLLAGLLMIPGSGAQQTSDTAQSSEPSQSSYPAPFSSSQQDAAPTTQGGRTQSQQTYGTGALNTPRGMTPNPYQQVDRAGLNGAALERRPQPAPESPTPFQLLVSKTLGTSLPLFGRNLFAGQAIDSAQPNAPPPTDYVVATGDQVLVRIWGPVTMNEALTIDRAGEIYLPQVGIIHVAGLPYSALDGQIRQSVDRVFRNYNLSVNLGSLHSIQIFVTGEAASPGAYTVSSLSTLVNAVFASGGPSSVGSMRAIELRRENRTLSTFDFYDLLVHGDKSKDVHLLPGDVIFIPPVGPEVALGGQIKVPAIYEMMPGETLGTLLSFAGGPNSIASATGVHLEQIVGHNHREARLLPLTPAGLATPVTDGDLLVVGGISHAFDETVTIRGNVASPGRFAWHPGMRLSEIIPEKASLLTPDYWDFRNAEGQRQPFFQPAPTVPAANQQRNEPVCVRGKPAGV
jgi:protein involved in polysaccharide export with SLBB domain